MTLFNGQHMEQNVLPTTIKSHVVKSYHVDENNIIGLPLV